MLAGAVYCLHSWFHTVFSHVSVIVLGFSVDCDPNRFSQFRENISGDISLQRS